MKSAKTTKSTKKTGVVVPLGALYTNNCQAIGDFPALGEFLPWCTKCSLEVVQLLPVNDTGTQSSPYSALSAFALHPIYIRIEALPEYQALYDADANFRQQHDDFVRDNPYRGRYDYAKIMNTKVQLLRALFASTEAYKAKKADKMLTSWIRKNQWVIEYAVYKNLKWRHLQATWKSWPKEDVGLSADDIKARWQAAADKTEHLFYAWCQMRAAEQFTAAAEAARAAGVVLKGDMPILMNEDSCDAWAHPDIFKQQFRAGAPVDGENPTGQNWGFPTYNWKYLKSIDYLWWIDRLKVASRYYGAYRLDHVLGFFRIWAVPERDNTAVLGHADPFKAITKKMLQDIGFDEGRIRWLTQPHVPTSVVESVTWNRDVAHKVLGRVCKQLGTEEMWLFKSDILGDKDIYALDLHDLVDDGAAARIKDALAAKWRDRCMVEAEKNKFAPIWTYTTTTAWQSLNDSEKQKLGELFAKTHAAEENLWKKQATEILSTLTQSVKMVPCGEDLGANLECLPSVMAANGILSLRVVRWSRVWGAQGQPFVPFTQYPILSVATTSVHDSPTIRQWWQDDKAAAGAFVAMYGADFGGKRPDECLNFTPQIAQSILTATARAGSMWCIHPLQDFLYMRGDCYLPNPADERVNVPGQVSAFNWTYRMPLSVETLLSDDILSGKIKGIADMHAR